MALVEILSSARREFFNAFQNAAATLVPRTVEALFSKVNSENSPIEQADIVRAQLLLQEHRHEIELQLTKNMQQLLDRSMETTYQNFRPNLSALSISADNLSLLDSSAFESSLRFNEVTQLFRNVAEQELIDLNIRIAVLFGQDDIRERENPFRPYLITRCIFLAVESLRLTQEMFSILAMQLGETLTVDIPGIYQQTNAELEKHGVHAHLSLKINKSAETLHPRGSSSVGTQQNVISSQQINNAFPAFNQLDFPAAEDVRSAPSSPSGNPSINIDQLFQVLRGREKTAFSAYSPTVAAQDNSSSPAWFANTSDLAELLRKTFGQSRPFQRGRDFDLASQEAQQETPLPSAEMAQSVIRGLVERFSHLPVPEKINAAPPELEELLIEKDLIRTLGYLHLSMKPDLSILNERGDVRNLIREQREAFSALARSTEELMIIDVLAMLFESILFDDLLSKELREQLGRLQFLLLQLALSDRTFLSNQHQAARLLLNRIASVLLGTQHLPVTQRKIEEEISRVFKTLSRHDCRVPELFERIYNRFDTFISTELRTQDKFIRRTVKSIEEAQIRYLRSEQTSSLLMDGLAKLDVPQHFANFLTTEWVRAINIAERTDTSLASHLRALVPDLIWSIQPKNSQEEQSQLSALLPGMLTDLRRGIAMLDWTQFKQNALLNWLHERHRGVLLPTQEFSTSKTLVQAREIFLNFLEQPAVVLSDSIEKNKYHEVEKYLHEVLAELQLNVVFIEASNTQVPLKNDDVLSVVTTQGESKSSEILQRLYSGAPIELAIDNLIKRGCIAWVNPNMSNLLLSMNQQAEPVIISYESFTHYSGNGALTFVENAPLIDRAVQAVLKSAEIIEKQAS
ncbi:DUF1631 family protein [Undibacterium sp. 14-3-2]|uniref:DUF1631 family protein n=1 Tax=Undibacterium sp. 14-3-2 TaxID=2800129 RepID=UPI001903229B|nr:DUF1631 family protein [Undibacterium sp. 14-3-2]MBK1888395.1 DUF1631 family protein [Undibacterium sp. 14-3-2]